MRVRSLFRLAFVGFFVLSPGVIAFAGQTANKTSSLPDAQVESNVLQALAGNATLSSQSISSSSVYGTVTLSGSVPDEATRTLAEQVVSRVSGVQKVIDELTLTGAVAAAGSPTDGATEVANATAPAEENNGSNPYLQSDGTLAQPNQEVPSQAGVGQDGTLPQVQPDSPPAGGRVPPAAPDSYPAPPVADNYPPTPSQIGQSAPQAPTQSAPAYPPYGYPRGSYTPPPNQPPSREAYGPPYGLRTPLQQGGEPVTVPAGTVLRVRTTQRLDSRSAQPGASFTAVVTNSVMANGYVAIPRGAQVTGLVSDAAASGVLKGRGELALQLTSVTLEGRTYPLASDAWAHSGADKTLRTVNSAVGLGALGAIIGGVAGGGAGAAIGAGVGGAAGIGASAASQGGQVVVPAEALLDFHLTQPSQLYTVSQAELDRLAAGPGMRPRYPVPPPYAYRGSYPYAYPYPYGYPRPVYRYPYPY